MTSKRAVTSEPIAPLLGERWSPRAFDADKAVSTRQLTQLMEAARWAPSCYNEQPWRYVVCDRNQSEADWEKALSCLVEGNRSWAARAPILMAAIASTQFTRNGKHNRWSEYDTGAASENLCLQATAMGLAAHQMGGFDAQAVIDTFQRARALHANGDDRSRLSRRSCRAWGERPRGRDERTGAAIRQ